MAAALKRTLSSASSMRSPDSRADGQVFPEPEHAGRAGYDRARQMHEQLLGVVDQLNDKVAAVLAKQEKEFLRAYRAHMYTVQRELQTLRAKADEAALQLARDERLRALEAERDWYRNESLRLDRFSTSLKGELSYLKDKLGALEADRDWLDRELRASKRQVALLQKTNAELRGEALPLELGEAKLEADEAEVLEALQASHAGGKPRPSMPAHPSSTPAAGRHAVGHHHGASASAEDKHQQALLQTKTSAELFSLLVPPGSPAASKPRTASTATAGGQGGGRLGTSQGVRPGGR